MITLNDPKRRLLVAPHELLLGGLDAALVGEHMLVRVVLEVHLITFGAYSCEEVLDLLGLGRYGEWPPPDNGQQLWYSIVVSNPGDGEKDARRFW